MIWTQQQHQSFNYLAEKRNEQVDALAGGNIFIKFN